MSSTASMSRVDAFTHSRKTGDKITHRYFSDDEFIIVQGSQVRLTEGFTASVSEFMRWRTDETWNEDWEIKTEK